MTNDQDKVPSGVSMDSLPDPPDGHKWHLIPELSDEFNGTELDSGKWVAYHHYWKGREPSHFDPGNVSVHGGNLQLRSTTEIGDLSEVGNPEIDVWVKSACVSSKKTSAFYGYYEARMKASRLSMTSSFWFQGKYSEIDVVEQLGCPLKDKRRSQYMLMNTHYFKGSWKNDKATPEQWEMPSGSAEEYHTYGVWWKDSRNIWFYHNGQKVAEVKTGGEFLEPMYMFFDTEVFIWEGIPTIESLKNPDRNTMYVDWVRAWKLAESGASGG
jgi:beta-glucanase (GH16 family)